MSGGLGGLGGLGGGGGHGGGGGDLGSMWSNGLGGQSGGPQTLFSGDALGHHPDPGLQQGLNQSAMNSSAASAAASSAAQVPLAASANAAMVAPAAAQGMPVTSDAQAAVAASGSAASGISGGHGGGVGSAMSPAPMMSDAGTSASSPMPLLPPATPHPAAPVSATGSGTTGTPGASGSGSGGPGVHPASTTGAGRGGFGGGPMMSSQAEAAPAPIPVSSARAEKEAIAQATRRHAGGDVQMAYRLAAALNADNMVNKGDFNFFWMTAVSADGQIVVANSYGLGYIPEVVALPAQVRMASADAGIPVAERARWTTYPSIALQGWAAHHNTTLRVVIGRERHFAGIDPGVPTQFMADEDIPTGGKMEGRSRLEVVAPADAARLTAAGDLALIDLLPPAPVDTTAPADQRNTLWFDVIKHLMSSDPDRGARQLEAFATYAAHAQELALRRAHTAVHAVEQRQTVADWLYWHHLHGVLGEALAGV
ncbi:hypothetical protein [Mycobacterium sp.]|uniref:hypothetical protein n=1 Tax=Mycobacterium sp. TaxID=1785 RepID=UPI0031D2CD91